MKNFLLLLFSILIGCLLAEIGIRSWGLPFAINISRTEFSERGYLLNPNSGTGWQQIRKTRILCHYYSPHLRDTAVNPQSIPILVLGDSFTFGWLLPAEQTYVHRLQIESDHVFGKDKYRFLNAAVGGWGAADFLAYLEEYGDQVSPKYVLIFLNTDDIGRAMKRNIYTLANAHSLQLTANFHPLPKIKLREMLFNNWLYEHSLLLQLVRNTISKYTNASLSSNTIVPASPDLQFDNALAIRYGEALFLSIHQWCKTHHAQLLVITTGFNAFYPKNLHDPTQIFLSQASSFFAKENIPYYDMGASFKYTVGNKNFQIPGDCHPNELGTKVITQLSWPWLKQRLRV